jgi:hypothetical protein
MDQISVEYSHWDQLVVSAKSTLHLQVLVPLSNHSINSSSPHLCQLQPLISLIVLCLEHLLETSFYLLISTCGAPSIMPLLTDVNPLYMPTSLPTPPHALFSCINMYFYCPHLIPITIQGVEWTPALKTRQLSHPYQVPIKLVHPTHPSAGVSGSSVISPYLQPCLNAHCMQFNQPVSPGDEAAVDKDFDSSLLDKDDHSTQDNPTLSSVHSCASQLPTPL